MALVRELDGVVHLVGIGPVTTIDGAARSGHVLVNSAVRPHVDDRAGVKDVDGCELLTAVGE